MNDLVKRSSQDFGQLMKAAEMVSGSELVPKHLQGKPSDCFLILSQADRWGMDPLAVAQCTSVVHGKLCYEGKLVHAALISMGVIDKGSESYEFSGSGQDRKIVLSASINGNIKTIDGTVKQWKTTNSKWSEMPDDMLIYRGWRQWARRHAPAAMLGVYTPDEMQNETKEADIVTIDAQDPKAPKPVESIPEYAKPEDVAKVWNHPFVDNLGPVIHAELGEQITVERLKEICQTLRDYAKADEEKASHD